MPNQAGSYFANTVTYICRHDSEGAVGIIINRAMEMSFKDLLQQIDIPASKPQQLAVLRGGPVNEDQGLVLHSNEQRFPETEELSNGLCLTFSRDVLRSIAAGEGPKQVLFALGYAGWGPGQLEAEIQQHAWLTLSSDSKILFDIPVQERLAYAQALTGVDLQLLSGRIGHD
ncbi:MAG: YqgE/AlgH family protein [Pseudomonadales bacterium]